MKPHNGNPAASIHRILILVAGLENPLLYTIARDEFERTWSFFNEVGWEANERPKKTFLLFETLVPRLTVVVRMGETQLVQFLTDPAITVVREDTEQADWHLRIFLRGRRDLFVSFIDNPARAEELLVRLDTDPEAAGEFLQFTNIEGEEVVVAASEIIVAEVDGEILRKTGNSSRPEDEEGHDLEEFPF